MRPVSRALRCQARIALRLKDGTQIKTPLPREAPAYLIQPQVKRAERELRFDRELRLESRFCVKAPASLGNLSLGLKGTSDS